MRGKNMSDTGTNGTRRYGRRSFLGLGAAAIAGTGAIVLVGRAGSAQDGTPLAGGTPEASPSASPAASPVASEGKFVVSTVDLAFEPDAFTIPANTDVTVRVENLGLLPHDFTLDQLGISSDLLSSGESAALTINAGPGTYGFHCSVPGHKQAGMRGTLTVE